MQTVDASIPLSVKPMQLDSPMQAYGQAMNLKQLQANTELKNMEVAQGMQTLKDQQELAHLAGDPSNIDPVTGGFKPEAMGKITNPMLRQKLNQSRLQQQKEQVDIDWKTSETKINSDKAKTNALHGVMEEAYSIYEDTRARTGNDQAATDAFNKALAGGYEEIRTTGRGGFPKDTQFKMLTPQEVGSKLIGHKERADEEAKRKTAERGEETPIIKETQYVERMKGKLADLAPGDPAAATIKQQIAAVQGHIARLDRIPGTGEREGKPPTGYERDPEKPGALRPIAGGPASRDKRDVLQADALSAYRAKYPYGYMPDQYGKTQPTPEQYVDDYLKKKEGGGKGMPAASFSIPPRPRGELKKVSSKKEFDDIKPGTWFIDGRTGKETVKGPAGKPVETRALGGDVQPDQPYVVGEQGPEIIVPDSSGMVIPNGATAMGMPALMGAMKTTPDMIQLAGNGMLSGLFGATDVMSPQERLALAKADGTLSAAGAPAAAVERTGQIQTGNAAKREQYMQELIARGMDPARAAAQAAARY